MENYTQNSQQDNISFENVDQSLSKSSSHSQNSNQKQFFKVVYQNNFKKCAYPNTFDDFSKDVRTRFGFSNDKILFFYYLDNEDPISVDNDFDLQQFKEERQDKFFIFDNNTEAKAFFQNPANGQNPSTNRLVSNTAQNQAPNGTTSLQQNFQNHLLSPRNELGDRGQAEMRNASYDISQRDIAQQSIQSKQSENQRLKSQFSLAHDQNSVNDSVNRLDYSSQVNDSNAKNESYRNSDSSKQVSQNQNDKGVGDNATIIDQQDGQIQVKRNQSRNQQSRNPPILDEDELNKESNKLKDIQSQRNQNSQNVNQAQQSANSNQQANSKKGDWRSILNQGKSSKVPPREQVSQPPQQNSNPNQQHQNQTPSLPNHQRGIDMPLQQQPTSQQLNSQAQNHVMTNHNQNYQQNHITNLQQQQQRQQFISQETTIRRLDTNDNRMSVKPEPTFFERLGTQISEIQPSQSIEQISFQNPLLHSDLSSQRGFNNIKQPNGVMENNNQQYQHMQDQNHLQFGQNSQMHPSLILSSIDISILEQSQIQQAEMQNLQKSIVDMKQSTNINKLCQNFKTMDCYQCKKDVKAKETCFVCFSTGMVPIELQKQLEQYFSDVLAHLNTKIQEVESQVQKIQTSFTQMQQSMLLRNSNVPSQQQTQPQLKNAQFQQQDHQPRQNQNAQILQQPFPSQRNDNAKVNREQNYQPINQIQNQRYGVPQFINNDNQIKQSDLQFQGQYHQDDSFQSINLDQIWEREELSQQQNQKERNFTKVIPAADQMLQQQQQVPMYNHFRENSPKETIIIEQHHHHYIQQQKDQQQIQNPVATQPNQIPVLRQNVSTHFKDSTPSLLDDNDVLPVSNLHQNQASYESKPPQNGFDISLGQVREEAPKQVRNGFQEGPQIFNKQDFNINVPINIDINKHGNSNQAQQQQQSQNIDSAKEIQMKQLQEQERLRLEEQEQIQKRQREVEEMFQQKQRDMEAERQRALQDLEDKMAQKKNNQAPKQILDSDSDKDEQEFVHVQQEDLLNQNQVQLAPIHDLIQSAQNNQLLDESNDDILKERVQQMLKQQQEEDSQQKLFDQQRKLEEERIQRLNDQQQQKIQKDLEELEQRTQAQFNTQRSHDSNKRQFIGDQEDQEQIDTSTGVNINPKDNQGSSQNPMKQSQTLNLNNPLSQDSIKKDPVSQYSMELVNETFKKRCAPGEVFTKEWILKNNGTDNWPKDTVLARVSGSPFVTSDPEINLSRAVVKPGEEIKISAVLTAPRKPGKFEAYFQLQYKKRFFISKKIWCDVKVKGDEDSSDQNSESLIKQNTSSSQSSSQNNSFNNTQQIFKNQMLKKKSSLFEEVEKDSHLLHKLNSQKKVQNRVNLDQEEEHEFDCMKSVVSTSKNQNGQANNNQQRKQINFQNDDNRGFGMNDFEDNDQFMDNYHQSARNQGRERSAFEDEFDESVILNDKGGSGFLDQIAMDQFEQKQRGLFNKKEIDMQSHILAIYKSKYEDFVSVESFQVYYLQVQDIKEANLKKDMLKFLEFKQEDFQLNYEILKQNNGNFEKAIEFLT
eukprot:403375284